MKGLAGVLAVALGLALAGCGTDLGDSSTAPVYLRITAVAGATSEGATLTFSNPLYSDVLWQDPAGTKPSTVFADLARLSIAAIPKNPDFLLWSSTMRTTSQMEDVRLERYEVVFTRTDGRNVAGVDVPQAIVGPMAATVPFDGSAEVTFEIVRHAAKEEPPLWNLRFGGGESLITCVADITVHGQTGAGQVVTANGRLQIVFGNFGN
jgi:hypothetical protein